MAYRVELTPVAETDLEEAYRYISRASPRNALRWWRRFYGVAERLSLIPEAYALAPENEAVPFEVRQKLYGNDRILFTTQDKRVIVLRVRHAARRPLPPEELHNPEGAG
jgi:plasmid stabilization system protein ParE